LHYRQRQGQGPRKGEPSKAFFSTIRLDCPVCDKAGECLLQDYSYRFGHATSRMIDPKNTPPNKLRYRRAHRAVHGLAASLCSRCVRFTREIAGSAELMCRQSRPSQRDRHLPPAIRSTTKLAGNVVDLCPVGALANKEFLYKQRVWFLKSQASVCAGCSTGCSIHVDHNKDIVYRLRPRENPQAQGHFICDEGRLRLRLRERQGLACSGRSPAWTAPSSCRPPGRRRSRCCAAKLVKTARAAGDSVAAVLSPMLTVEEAYLLAKFIKGLSADARLYLGWVPVVGADEHFPQDRKGKPLGPVKFTIRAEKCPEPLRRRAGPQALPGGGAFV